MSRRHLFKQSKGYSVVKSYTSFVYNIFYSEVCIIGLENLPENEPLVFAPNHQNGLMDALAAGLPLKTQPVFMARADIFTKGITGRILHFLKIIPVFRLKDGVDKLSSNDDSFATALEVLKSNQPVIIMPEGGHQEQRMLKPLKKGIVRFALDANEQLNKSVKIIPVGLHYSNYHSFRSRVLVIYGERIDVADYAKEFGNNPQVAYNRLRNTLADELKKIMLNIDNEEYYDLIMYCQEIYNNQLFEESDTDYYQKFFAAKKITDRLTEIANTNPDQLNPLLISVREYQNGLKRLSLDDCVFDWLIPKRDEVYVEAGKMILFLPFFAGTVLLNAIPAFISNYFAKKTTDPQFVSSFRFALGAIVFPVFYLLFLLFFPIPLYTKVILLLPMPILIPLAYDFYAQLRKQWMKYRYFKLLKIGNYELNNLRTLRDKILQTIDGFI